MIVSCQNVKKYHGAQLVLEQITFEIPEGGRVGLIGRNGCGKTTLLRLIAGEERPDEGELAIRKDTRIGYLKQIPEAEEHLTVYDILARGYREVLQLKDRMGELEQAMSDPALAEDPDRLTELLRQYASAQERFEHGGGYEMEARIAQVAAGLRIDAGQFGRGYGSLSGGEKTKVALASLLIERPTLLLLDEPTNHLDLRGVEWLEDYLRDYGGTCVIVSHDRYFLDKVVTRIVEIEDGEASLYLTSYSEYVKEKEERLLRQFAQYQEQQKQIAKMKETIKQLETWGRIGGNEKFFRRAASMRKALDRMEKIKRPVLDPKTADFAAGAADRSGTDVIAFEGLTKSFGSRAILDRVDGSLRYGDKTAIVGDNGAGKSTLFKLLLGEISPDGGEVRLGARVEIGYLGQEEKPAGKTSILEFFKEEAQLEEGEARRLLAKQLFYGPDVFKSLSSISGGEWTRLRLALLMHRKPNLLLLDEPTNHLDIVSREALEEALDEFPGTVLVVSHDRYFMNRIAGRIWEVRNGGLTSFLGHYDDYRERRIRLGVADDLSATRVSASVTTASTSAGGAETKRAKAPAAKTEAARDLESAISGAEAELGRLDAELESAGTTADAADLAKAWERREKLQERLDRLYEEWMAGQ